MFETFKVKNFYIIMDSILSLYAFGPTSGIVLEMGAGISTIVPIYEGQV